MKKLLLLILMVFVSNTHAQPATTRFIVPYPPGGGTDITARAYAEAMRVSLKRNVIVENRPGAGGLLGATSVAKASPADGSVILLGNVVINVLSAYTNRNLQYDPSKDLAPVSLLARLDIALAVGPMVPAKDLKEFIAWAKANPKLASYGHPAAGSLPHFFGILLGQAVGVELVPVAYKGSPAMNNDLMGGQLASVVNAATDTIPLHKAGRIRMLATAGDERGRGSPDVPTFKESGFPGIRGTSWFAAFAPAATPPEEIQRLSRAVRDGAADPQVRKAIEALGIEVAASTPEELAKMLDAERARWAPIVKASGFTAAD